jgi:hypothetical protein
MISPKIINNGMALNVKEFNTFHTASKATYVAPLAMNCKMRSPVSPSAAPRASPEPEKMTNPPQRSPQKLSIQST